MVTIRAYQPSDQKVWDGWIASSRNHCLLFNRGYMDYHSDRFNDRSLMFFEDGRLVAVLPANSEADTFTSHGGLTYGGFVCDRRMTAARMLTVFEALAAWLREASVKTFVYKCLPHIYHEMPCEEDLYALFVHGAELFKRDVSSALFVPHAQMAAHRLRGAKKSASLGVEIKPFDGYEEFMRMVSQRLEEKYALKVVHTAEEVRLLAGRFPDAIRLFGAFLAGKLVAGVLVYESRMVAHIQYLSSNEEGRRLRAQDLLITHLLTGPYQKTWWFDFGISTEDGGAVFNENLFKQKEEYGAYALCYDTYRIRVGETARRSVQSRKGVLLC